MREPTLVVLGAGASVDLGFPSGPKLRSKIAAALKFKFEGWDIHGGSKRIRSLLMEQESSHRGDPLKAADHVSRNLPLSESIDSYLKSNPEPNIEKISKVAICDVIAEAEHNCALQTAEAAPQRFSFSAIEEFWATRLFARLHRGLEKEESPAVIFENVRFVTFNYDTLDEHLREILPKMLAHRAFKSRFDELRSSPETFANIQWYCARLEAKAPPIDHLFGRAKEATS